MNNLQYWNMMKQPPSWALKKIEAGRLKGKSDINPQWRYMAMTETFGPAGIGWKFTIDKLWTEPGADGEILAFAQVSVFVKSDDAWSEPVPGVGGSTLIAKESKGMHNNDEAFKMAITDAMSTALKMFGVAADIYAGMADGSKYSGNGGKNDDIITASAWDAWIELTQRASVVNVPVEEVDRSKTNKTQLRAKYKDLLDIVTGAEDQAKAGS